jgi:hypothetical protein
MSLKLLLIFVLMDSIRIRVLFDYLYKFTFNTFMLYTVYNIVALELVMLVLFPINIY